MSPDALLAYRTPPPHVTVHSDHSASSMGSATRRHSRYNASNNNDVYIAHTPVTHIIALYNRNMHTKIYLYILGTFVCPPHISETVAVRIMKRAHRPRIASKTNKLISKQMLLSILSIIL